MTTRCCLVALAALLAASQSVQAQADTARAMRPAFLDSMRVTGYRDAYAARTQFSALRLNTELSRVPLSVTVLSRDLLKDQAVSNVNDAFKNSAGVQSQAGTLTRPNFYAMRGFAAFSFRDGVRLLIDGEAPISAMSLESIEILKGPSSILYGRGEPGGLVNFVSKRPLPVSRQLVQMQYGSFDNKQVDLDVTGPVAGSSSVAWRFVGGYRNSNSYRSVVNDKQYYMSPSLAFGLGHRVSGSLSAEVGAFTTVPDFGVLYPASGTLPSTFTRQTFLGDPSAPASRVTTSRVNADIEARITDHWTLRAAVTHAAPKQIGYTRLEAFIDAGPTGYVGLIPANELYRRKWTEDVPRSYTNPRIESVFTFAHAMGSLAVEHQLLVMADTRVEHEDRTVDLSDFDLYNYATNTAMTSLVTPYGTLPFGVRGLWDEHWTSVGTNKDAGASVQDLVRVGEKVNLLVGARYESNVTESRRTGGYTQNKMLGGQPVSLNSAPPTSRKSDLAPRFGILVEVAPGVRTYASYLTSFEAPIPGLLTAQGALLKPELGKQYEGGLKADLFNRRASLTASVFDIAKTDVIVVNGMYGQNIGEERVKGFDVELAGNVTQYWRLVSSLSRAQHRYTKGDAALLNHQRPGVSTNTASFWSVLDLRRHVKGASVGAGAFYQDKMWANSNNTISLPGGTTFDAMAAYERGAVGVQLNWYNLTNAVQYIPTGGFSAGNDPNIMPATAIPSAPSRIVLTVRVMR